MDGSVRYFDPVLIRNMVAAFDATMARYVPLSADTPSIRFSIASRIIHAARTGERDQRKLEMAANSHMTVEQRLPIPHRSSS